MKSIQEVKADFNAALTEQFMQLLENSGEETSWAKLWKGLPSNPISGESGKKYRGINSFYLTLVQMNRGYEDRRWFTVKQLNKAGLMVRKGEKGSRVVYFMPYYIPEKKAITWDRKDELIANGAKESEFRITHRTYAMFNLDQAEGDKTNLEMFITEEPLHTDSKVSESILKTANNMGVEVMFNGGDQCYYELLSDKIHLPKEENFATEECLNLTLLHEMVHSTGNKSRLARHMVGSHGSEGYAKEELVAEMGACFASQYFLQTEEFTFQNNQAYLKGWLKALPEKERNTIVPESIKKAIEAAEFIKKHM